MLWFSSLLGLSGDNDVIDEKYLWTREELIKFL